MSDKETSPQSGGSKSSRRTSARSKDKPLPLSAGQRVNIVNQVRADAMQILTFLDRFTSLNREVSTFDTGASFKNEQGEYIPGGEIDEEALEDFLDFSQDFEKFLNDSGHLSTLYRLARR